MENKYYVYAYLNPNKPCKLELNGVSFLYEPFYIGKGKDNRCNIHLISSRLKINKHLSNTIKKIGVDKVRPFITKIYTNLSEKDAIDLEILHYDIMIPDSVGDLFNSKTALGIFKSVNREKVLTELGI